VRSLEQNRLMWANLEDIAQQVIWHGLKLDKYEWKDVLTAGLKKQKIVPGIEGGFVVIGARTSKMSIAEMNELIELSTMFGAQQGVKFRAIEE
jgi:urease gamma subunit